jgi:hypothetical protein
MSNRLRIGFERTIAAVLEPRLFGSVKLVRGLASWSNVIESGAKGCSYQHPEA